METDALSSMYAQIVGGRVPKEESQFVTDAESGQVWDSIAAEVAKPLTDGGMWEMVNEIP